jgi:hypothetical protein
MSLRKNIEGQFGLDRRDPAIRKADGMLYELENMMVDEGSMKTREGLTRFSPTALEVGNRILALHRYWGLDANDGTEIKEFYAATAAKLKKWSGGAWTDLALPPDLTLTNDKKGIFRQMRDRTYYSNYDDPVLMIKKEDNQVHTAGIPDANVKKEIQNCETLDVTSTQQTGNPPTPALAAGKWTIWTDGETRDLQCYLDSGFDKHTKGDYGITLEAHGSGDTVELIHRFASTLDLEWFFGPTNGTAEAGSVGNTLKDTGAFNATHVGQEVKNNTDGSQGVIVELVDADTVRTTLEGGTNNDWGTGDTYSIGSPSSMNDHIAFDLFRWNKIDIDEVAVEFSSVAPDNNGDFSKGFRVVVYSDTGFEHYNLKQRTMLAEWANNPHGNRLFFCKFRKRWFVHIGGSGNIDDWGSIKYMKVQIQQNAQSSFGGAAKVTIDNIRLQKTSPIAGELKLQVATCDATEIWTNTADEYGRATEGLSCKIIANNVTATYTFEDGVKNLSQYADGVNIDGSDVFIFDVCGSGIETVANVWMDIKLVDNANKTAIGVYLTPFNFADPQSRSLHVQEFIEQSGFNWSIVKRLEITNRFGGNVAIDNIRIQPAAASKLINKFQPMDIIGAKLIEEGIDHLFGNNPIVDAITDFFFHQYATFTRKASGQGNFLYPDTTNGRYKFGDFSSPCLSISADPGGSFSMSFIQNTDLTEYQDYNFNLDAFFHPKEYSETHTFGIDWVEIPAMDSDELSIWMSSPDWAAVNKVIFRFYTNQKASWSSSSTTSTHTNAGGYNAGKVLQSADTSIDFRGKIGKRIYNETTGDWGIIGWAPLLESEKHRCSTWGVTWTHGDTFSFEGFGFGGAGQKPVPDTDDYYEYVFDAQAAVRKLSFFADKSLNKKLAEYHVENREAIEGLKTIYKQDGFQQVNIEQPVGGSKKGNVSMVVNWKRGDMVHHKKSAKPWAGFQCIASHQIIVEATSKKSGTVSFNDWVMKKKGAVRGEVAYKMRLEDEQGYLGPISDASDTISPKGVDCLVTDLYVPFDTRIKRKRLYRPDVTGTYRYLDTIDRVDKQYLDQVPEDLLGETIEEEFFKPPRANVMSQVQNRMAYADIVDRDGRYRPGRVQLSLPFRPHQCSDADVFDVLPEDGQRVMGFEWYYGVYYCWKEKSFYTVDPNSYEYIPREKKVGLIAKESLDEIPGLGYGWLSHEGPKFGNANGVDHFTGRLIWDDFKNLDKAVLAKAVGFYYDDYYYLFVGENNELGYALHVPTKSWFYISNWNVQCVSIFNAGSDNSELYAGSKYGYINRLLNGNTDLSDDAFSTESEIAWAFRTLDYDFEQPVNDKYPRWIFSHAKNLVAGVANKAQMIITPYLDQMAGDPYTTITLNGTRYVQYKASGRSPTIGGEKGTLVGMRVAGTKRCAIRNFFIEAGDLGFRPNLC